MLGCAESDSCRHCREVGSCSMEPSLRASRRKGHSPFIEHHVPKLQVPVHDVLLKSNEMGGWFAPESDKWDRVHFERWRVIRVWEGKNALGSVS